MTDLIQMTATAIVEGLRSGDITPLDCLDALERRVAGVDGKVNALPTICFDRARTQLALVRSMQSQEAAMREIVKRLSLKPDT